MVHLISIAQRKHHVTDAEQARAEERQQLGVKVIDALHVACAKTGGADAFLTTDDQLLSAARKHHENVRVRVENPSIWLMEVS